MNPKLILLRAVPFLFVAESAFLFYMALQPSSAVPTFGFPFFRNGDLEHFLAYLVYGILGYKTFSMKCSPKKSLTLSLSFCMLFAGFTEGIQAFVPTRVADPADWIVDSIGSGAGIYALRTDLPRRLRLIWPWPS
ncbi:MAG TPA: VanZ family protein [archaeon]|nr:VanZ family protein [archaeon]